MALPDGTLPFSGGAMMGGDGSAVSRDDIFKLRMKRGVNTAAVYDPLQSPDTEVDINETKQFDITQPGIYAQISQSIADGRTPVVTAGSSGNVRLYYYTSQDGQNGTITFTCGYNGKVELLTLHSDNTFEFSSSVTSDYIMAYGVNTFSASDAAAPLAQFSKQGDSLWIDGDGILHAKAGVYHVDYDSRVYIASGQDDIPEDAIRNMDPSVNYQDGTNNNAHEVDLSYRHAEHINKSFDIKLTQERTIAFSMQQAGGIVRYTLFGFNVFKIAEV